MPLKERISVALSTVCLLLLFFSRCATPEPAANLPATWIWKQDQNSITPGAGSRNLWNGWTITNDSFVARDSVSRFIIWRKARSQSRLQVAYTLIGQPASLIVNNKKKANVLEPSPSGRQASFAVQLKKGLNFLEFRKQAKDKLRIQSLALGQAPVSSAPRRAQLESGESLTAVFQPGSGRIEFSGKGELIMETRRAGAAGLTTQTQRARAGFFSRRIVQELDFDRPAIFTAIVASGAFNVSRYAFKEKSHPTAASPYRVQGKPPVFILLIDACQAKHLHLYGYPRETSPDMERFARDGVVFENAYANASYTRSSVRSLLSGQFPERSGAGNLTRVGENRQLVIPEFLKIKGYRTAIFTSAVTISPTFGFTRGIDDYIPFTGELVKWKERRFDFDRFSTWLKRPEPLFAYFHFIEPHLPIVAPPPYLDMFKARPGLPRQQRLINQVVRSGRSGRAYSPVEVQDVCDDYDSTIAYIDNEIGKTLERIRRSGLYDESLIVVLSDHGEAIYEHGAWGHSTNVFEETTHVPLIAKFPSSLNLKGRVRTLVQLTDIFPTLVELFGQKIDLPGKSLLGTLHQPEVDDSLTVSQSIAEVALFGLRWRDWYAVIDLKTNGQRLFNLAADPIQDISDTSGPMIDYFWGSFLEWWKNLSDSETESSAIDLKKLTPTEIENLKTLGYL